MFSQRAPIDAAPVEEMDVAALFQSSRLVMKDDIPYRPQWQAAQAARSICNTGLVAAAE